MRRLWLKRIGAVLLALPVLLALALWLVLRGSLPQLDGQITASVLTNTVRIDRDALGTVSIRASNRADIAYALGYVHGQERFFEMDLLRRRASGELSALIGASTLATDRSARLHRFRHRVEGYLAATPQPQRVLIQRYSDGVNAGLSALGARPFPYLLLGTTPQPWTEADVVLAPLAMYFDLQDSENRRELQLEQLRSALPPELYAFLTASGTEWDAPIVGGAYADPPVPAAEVLDLRAVDIADPPADVPASSEGIGSNNFAVAGALTPHRGAILANDMHLGLRVPNIWFRAQWQYPDSSAPGGTRVVTGVSLPGTPFMVVGSNGQVAWGFTNSYGDWLDFVALTPDPADPNRYAGPDGWEPITTTAETLEVRGGANELLQVRETRFGPIVAAGDDGRPLALMWTAHHAEAVNVGLADMEGADTLDAALAVAHRTGIPVQNAMIATADGQIAWTPMGRIPRRAPGVDGMRPQDARLAQAGWQGFLDPVEVPAVINPPEGRLWTANARTLEGAAAGLLGDGGYTIGARAGQIRDDLRARTTLSEADLLAVQLDDRALFLTRWHALLRQLVDSSGNPALKPLKAALADWNGRADPSSSAYRAVREFRLRTHKRFLMLFSGVSQKGETKLNWPTLPQLEGAVWRTLSERPAHLLPRNYSSWDAWLEAAATDVVNAMALTTRDPAQATWGEANATRIRHPLSQAIPGMQWLLDMRAEQLPGDQYMPRVQGPRFGASERMVVAPGHEELGYFHMPGGQSGHPLSPYYGAGHADWAQGKPSAFLPGAAEHTLTLAPP